MVSKSDATKIEAYQRVFKGQDGETVLQDLMSRAGFFDSVASNTDDAMFNEGARSVVVSILKIVDLDMKKFRDFMKEEFKGDEEHV